MKARAKIKLTNSAEEPLNMLLEPWADEMVLLSGESADLTAVGPDPVELEIRASDNSIVIYGWTGSICELAKNTGGSAKE